MDSAIVAVSSTRRGQDCGRVTHTYDSFSRASSYDTFCVQTFIDVSMTAPLACVREFALLRVWVCAQPCKLGDTNHTPCKRHVRM